MDLSAKGFERVGSLKDLEREGRVVLHGRHRPILVVHDRGRVFALDNRCPHMGFPLDKGSLGDGILTCHWHHARFDLASGCAFDLWADDIPACPVVVENGEVWVKPVFDDGAAVERWTKRLTEGMAHNIGLVIAKSVQGMLAADAAPRDVLRDAVVFGVRNRDGWSTGMTIATALGNLLPALPEEQMYLAMLHGSRRIASDCAGESPRRERSPLGSVQSLDTLKGWLRRWSEVRHREGAERTVLTAIAGKASPAQLADLLFSAETDRPFADGGHSLDFINKAFECLDLVGWDRAADVLPTVVGQMVEARGADEETSWRQPADLVDLLDDTFEDLPELFGSRANAPWSGHSTLAGELLADDPKAIVASLKTAIHAGATAPDLGRALAYAAALRVARFGVANEHSDWETAHHAFTYCNAVHQALKRIHHGAVGNSEYSEAVRAVFHGAMAVYLNRYLTMPPARLPGEEGDDLDDLPVERDAIADALLSSFDRQRQVDEVGRLVARYLTLGYPAEGLVAVLARCLLREDAGFHAYQMLEAGWRQAREWGDGPETRHILIGVGRYLAAHSPTTRALFQTADIARRLMRGGQLHAEDGKRQDER